MTNNFVFSWWFSFHFVAAVGGCGNIRHTLHRHFCNRWKTRKKGGVAKFWHTSHKASAVSSGNTRKHKVPPKKLKYEKPWLGESTLT